MAILAASSVLSGTTSQALTTTAVPLVGKSGLPWNSLVFGHGSSPETFERWRNRPVDGVVYFPARGSWSQMGQLPRRRAGDLMVYSIPPFPVGTGGSNAKVAAGTYNNEITALAVKMVSAGWNTNRTVIRLGWENNGSWYEWAWNKGGTAAYVAAFRKFVTVSRAAGLTNVRWDWNLNKGSQNYNRYVDWTTGYPGDAYVDVIGIDPYDMWSPTFTDADWQANVRQKNPGLNDVADFARARGKQVAIDEWGVTHAAGGGGDNRYYVKRVFEWSKANAAILAWESVYDGSPYSSYNTNLSSGLSNPRAAAQYRTLYPNGWGR